MEKYPGRGFTKQKSKLSPFIYCDYFSAQAHLSKFLSARSLTTSLVLNSMDMCSLYLILPMRRKPPLFLLETLFLGIIDSILLIFILPLRLLWLTLQILLPPNSILGLPPNLHTFPKQSPIPSFSIYMIPLKSLFPVQSSLQTCIIVASITFSWGHSKYISDSTSPKMNTSLYQTCFSCVPTIINDTLYPKTQGNNTRQKHELHS